jgi:PhzF family phenazine biosynthesis protein
MLIAFIGLSAWLVLGDPLYGLVKTTKDLRDNQRVADAIVLLTPPESIVISGNFDKAFTPVAEIELCGHATLSTAHIMYETGIVKTHEEISFTSKAGILRVRKDENLITMNFPAYTLNEIEIPVDFEQTTGIDAIELYRTGHGWTLALVKDEEELKNIRPNLKAMKDSEFGDMIVTSPSTDKKFDFCVRCFVPALGIDEDPVTGSAHCSLTPFWHGKTGRTEFLSHQISKRGGILKVSLKGDRVEISGEAVTIFKAKLFV